MTLDELLWALTDARDAHRVDGGSPVLLRVHDHGVGSWAGWLTRTEIDDKAGLVDLVADPDDSQTR